MTLRTRRLRAAFTLIELMVVMAIIALLLSLLLSGVQRARLAVKRGSAHTEIRELGSAIGSFKQKLNADYIPSKIVLREDGAYVTNSPDANRNKLEQDSINWLKSTWSQITFPVDWNQNGSIQTNVAYDLEGDQCLVFFLGGIRDGGQLVGGFYLGGQPSGFSTNRRNPMDTSTKERVGPFIQFQTERLIRREATTAGSVGFYSYVDPWKAQPYAYFSSYGKQKGYMPYLEPSPSTLPLSDCHTLQSSPSRVYHYVDPATSKAKQVDSFQIISAGEDKVFGPGGTNLPATGPGEDDIANFSQGTLGSGN